MERLLMSCRIGCWPSSGTARNPKIGEAPESKLGPTDKRTEHGQSNLQASMRAMLGLPVSAAFPLTSKRFPTTHSAHDAATEFTAAIGSMASSATSLFISSASFRPDLPSSEEHPGAGSEAPYIYPATPPVSRAHASGNGSDCL
jgi:hypothetical protein